MDVFAPSIHAALPDEWFAKESITLLAPDGQANIIASSEPLRDDMDAFDYAEVQGQLLRDEFPQYEQHEYGPWLVFGGRPGYRRVFQWEPPDGVTVVQIQLYYARARRGYTATATTPSVQYAHYSSVLQASLDGLHLRAATDTVPTR